MKKSKLETMLKHLDSINLEYSKLPFSNLLSIGIRTDEELSAYVKSLLPEFDTPYFREHKRDEFKEAYFMNNDNERVIASYVGFGCISVNSKNKGHPATPHAIVHEIVHMKAVSFDERLATLLGWEVGSKVALKRDSVQKHSLLYVLQSSLYAASYFQAKKNDRIGEWKEKVVKIFGQDLVGKTETLNGSCLFLKSPEDYTLRPYSYVIDQMNDERSSPEICSLIKFLKKIV